MGEGEEQLPEVLALIRELRASGAPRADILREVARRVGGAYVPSLYRWRSEDEAQAAGSWAEPLFDDVPRVVHKRVFEGFADSPALEPMIVPYTEVVHDRLNVEILRGCARGCRFCQAGMMYRPVRERSADNIVDAVARGLAETGYDEVSLTSLSSTDHSQIAEILSRVNADCAGAGVRVSVPSQRLDAFGVEMAQLVAGQKKGGLTFAPEAGTQRLRDVINKNVTWDEIEKTCSLAFANGYTSVKLYFMMGLPTETMEDIEGIAETAQKVVDLYYSNPKHAKGRGVQVTISCACFVPKPHTPFQFVPMDTEEMLKAKQKHLLESVHSRKIKVNYHDSTTSFLEGVFAKGDRRLAPVILEAYKRGCYFDGWEECFQYDTWLKVFEDMGIDPKFYCQRPIGLDEVTPWSHMDYGVTHEYLVREYNKALAAQTTQPCNRACHGCGANHLLGGPCFDYSQDLV